MNEYLFQNNLINKKELKQILYWVFKDSGAIEASILADKLKTLGFKYSTLAGISISIEDLRVLALKNSIIKKADQEITKTYISCLKGKITEVEHFQKIVSIWNSTGEIFKKDIISYFQNYDPLNCVYIMSFSGARGNLSQVRQLISMRGLMSDPSGEIINLPIKKNFREGLTVTDYLISSYGARKGVVDTALKTANSGYLTRRLIDVAQDIIIKEKDCFTKNSLFYTNLKNPLLNQSFINNKILGRSLNKSVPNLIKKKNSKGILLNRTHLPLLSKSFSKVFIRSPLTCELNNGLCQKCYGLNLITKKLINLGEAVGIIAGQSIGEPGTQLTMRTFHTGGVFDGESLIKFISPVNGILEFPKFLKINSFRTETGENVLKTENTGYLNIIVNNHNVFKIEIPADTLIFVKNQTYIQTNTLIGQYFNTYKQVKLETKNVLSKISGEISFQKNLIWLLKGKNYIFFENSFLNKNYNPPFIKHNFISRVKVINKTLGIFEIRSNNLNFNNSIFRIKHDLMLFKNFELKKIISELNHSLILNVQKDNFLLNYKLKSENSNIFAKLISKMYSSNTGGTPFFLKNCQNFDNNLKTNYCQNFEKIIMWLPEENNYINRDVHTLLIENSEQLNENSQITNNICSKISGVSIIIEQNDIIKNIKIKPGILYRTKNYKRYNNKIIFPGESNKDISVEYVSISQIIKTNLGFQILIRPISIYNIPKIKSLFRKYKNSNVFFKHSIFSNLHDKQKIDSNLLFTLYEEKLIFEKRNFIINISFKILSNFTKDNGFLFESYEDIKTNKLINKKEISLLVKNGQFVNPMTILGYFETISEKLLNWLKIKITLNNRNLFFIRKKDCFTIPTNLFLSKKVNDIINDSDIISYKGKILNKNPYSLIVQKGFPYFFLQNLKKIYKNGSIIKKNKKIGELVFEKEITGDIVQGLPRIEQIFEARKNSIINHSFPKIGLNSNYKLITLNDFIDLEKNINFHILLNLYILHYQKFLNLYQSSYKSLKKIQNLILNLIQSVYLSQNVSILDKHLEVIIKQMTTRVKIVYSNKNYFNVNRIIELNKINYINTLLFIGKESLIIYEPIILGITNVSLLTDSFLSSASFQETTNILAKSALYNKIDWLRGLKENVITGRLIPAGTGFMHKQKFNYNFFLNLF